MFLCNLQSYISSQWRYHPCCKVFYSLSRCISSGFGVMDANSICCTEVLEKFALLQKRREYLSAIAINEIFTTQRKSQSSFLNILQSFSLCIGLDGIKKQNSENYSKEFLSVTCRCGIRTSHFTFSNSSLWSKQHYFNYFSRLLITNQLVYYLYFNIGLYN